MHVTWEPWPMPYINNRPIEVNAFSRMGQLRKIRIHKIGNKQQVTK